jgi:hypothetical protein
MAQGGARAIGQMTVTCLGPWVGHSLRHRAEVPAPSIDGENGWYPLVAACQNHPSGDPTPSPEDISVTREIVQAGRLLDIEVLDHLVMGHHHVEAYFCHVVPRLREHEGMVRDMSGQHRWNPSRRPQLHGVASAARPG